MVEPISVHQMAQEYEFRGCDGAWSHTPDDDERAMLEDFGEGVLAEIAEPRIRSPEAERDALKALAEEASVWKPTHRHYRTGALVREIMRTSNGFVLYDLEPIGEGSRPIAVPAAEFDGVECSYDRDGMLTAPFRRYAPRTTSPSDAS